MAENNGVLRNLRFKRVSLVDSGANLDAKTGDGAHIMLYKSKDGLHKDGPGLGSVHVDSPDWDATDADDYEKATLDAAGRRALSDADFAAVWTDAKGNKHRKLPIHDAGHLAAARGRVDAANIPADVKAAARRKIDAKTHSAQHSTHKEKPVAKSLTSFVKSLIAAIGEPDAEKRANLLKEAEAAAPPEPGSPEHEGEEMHHIEALQNLHKDMGAKIKAYGAGPHPADHPVHKMKAMHEHMGKMLKEAGVECPTDEPGALGKEAEAAVEHVTKRMTEIEKQNVDLTKQLREEREVRLDGEMRTILKSFKATPLKLEGADNDVTRFRKMKESDPGAFDRTMEIMKAQDAMVAQSVMFKNLGAGGGGAAGDAWSQLEAKADAMLEKDTKGLTREQALDIVMKKFPKLAREASEASN